MDAKIKQGIIYSAFIIVILLLLFDKCNTPVVEPEPEKTEYSKGKDSIVYIPVEVSTKGSNPDPDSVYLVVENDIPCDDSTRHYPLTENDSTGGTAVGLTVKGRLLDYEITRTCFNTEKSRVDTFKIYMPATPRRMLSMGGFSGVIGTQFTFGVAAYYTDKRQMSVGVLVDPINKGGVGVVTVPIGLRK